MSLCENCKSLDICSRTDKNKDACFFFSPTEDYRIKNSKEYAIGYERGRADREKELEMAFKSLLGSEYSWWEIVEKAEQLKEQSDE